MDIERLDRTMELVTSVKRLLFSSLFRALGTASINRSDDLFS